MTLKKKRKKIRHQRLENQHSETKGANTPKLENSYQLHVAVPTATLRANI